MAMQKGNAAAFFRITYLEGLSMLHSLVVHLLLEDNFVFWSLLIVLPFRLCVDPVHAWHPCLTPSSPIATLNAWTLFKYADLCYLC